MKRLPFAGATCRLIALLALLPAPPASAAATFLVFHSPSGNGDAIGGKPAALSLAIPVGGSASVRAFLENYDPQGPGSADPTQICVSATSNHVCGWKIHFFGAGVRIDGFTSTAGPNPIDFQRAQDGSSLDVVGGSANGEAGPVSIGTLQVTALVASGTLVAQSSFLDAAGTLQSPSARVVAAALDSCGNRLIEPPEQCDDGNRVNGDGCYRTCRNEASFTLSGAASGGTIQLSFAERPTVLVIPTIPGESGVALSSRVAAVMNEDPVLLAATRSGEAVGNGRVVTDATLRNSASTDTGIGLVPEPDAIAQLAAGVALLGWLARRRRARRR